MRIWTITITLYQFGWVGMWAAQLTGPDWDCTLVSVPGPGHTGLARTWTWAPVATNWSCGTHHPTLNITSELTPSPSFSTTTDTISDKFHLEDLVVIVLVWSLSFPLTLSLSVLELILLQLVAVAILEILIPISHSYVLVSRIKYWRYLNNVSITARSFH